MSDTEEILRAKILRDAQDREVLKQQLQAEFGTKKDGWLKKNRTLQRDLRSRWSSGAVVMVILFLVCIGAGAFYFMYKRLSPTKPPPTPSA